MRGSAEGRGKRVEPAIPRLLPIRLRPGIYRTKIGAEEIKRQLSIFLQEELQLTLSPEKTLITHARNDAAKFLGYEITTFQVDTKQSTTRGGVKRRSINGKTELRVPGAILLEKCN